MTLTDFLLARIAEDEAKARDPERGFWQSAHPKRILAECGSKRRIVQDYRLTEEDGLFIAIRHLAAAYADHPDYPGARKS